MSGLLKWALPLAFLASCSSEPATSAAPNPASCDSVLRDRGEFRKEMQLRAQTLKAELEPGAAKPNLEAYPKLKDSQKLMEFETDLEAGENKFTVRLQDCQEAKK